MNAFFSLAGRCLGVGLFAVFLTGCAGSKGLYYWGDYEALLLEKYVEPGRLSTEQELEQMEQLVLDAAERGRPVPPGVFLHLGMLYAEVGNESAALKAFNEEKIRFPESRVFVDGVLSRAEKRAQDNRSEY